ncbi:nicotinate (nicotinamide) nucleotide adenylyltransferase [Catenisphaera adipataccumulans]|jgi:nicotinate-nucleotide adenylyltransferase|uniref:Probable nicotinate-nucleotide adenylyltransferase n=1 Tax=Catenisphaera adipataccumulans TaxID=700500 RepID=A0A7W8CXL2_9FIRM|nr:nicotinate (nicotinamide) nucleotide adenylyltransferase [Catenisphaera adipataccumulans]MBB5183478.1 nicotinate-nucleotide adenylyltransferase [Catenisphaera adipataccumulans]
MKIAIVGGSFDPVHEGHIAMAEQAVTTLGCDQAWFMPSKKTPLKDRGLTDDVHRLAMLKIVAARNDRFRVCTMELERQGISYTVDTLRQLKQMYPHDTFYWLIGNDQLKQFADWKEPETLVKLAHFVCFDRNGELNDTNYAIQRCHMPMMPVSSSEIRCGNKLNYLPREVLNYIYDHRLYVKGFIESRVKPHRYRHSVSVANLCEEMARANHLDTQKAYYIGLFHDVAKAMPKQAMIQWMDILCPENEAYPVPVWHGFVGSEIVDRIFYIDDPQIKAAIYHHVLGTSTDPYAEIVFCADKTDPLRGYDSSAMIEACKKDIDAGFAWCKEENKKYLNQ